MTFARVVEGEMCKDQLPGTPHSSYKQSPLLLLLPGFFFNFPFFIFLNRYEPRAEPHRLQNDDDQRERDVIGWLTE